MFDGAEKINDVLLQCSCRWLIFFFFRFSVAYLCFPRIGLRPIITLASADLTCWLGSATRSFTYGRTFVMMMVSWLNESRFWQKSRTLSAAAARTSASVSFSRAWNAGTRSALVISGPTAFWSYDYWGWKMNFQTLCFGIFFGLRFIVRGLILTSVNLSATM